MNGGAGLAWLLAVAVGAAWSPPSGGPSAIARRVLDSIPEPRTVPIPAEVERRSRFVPWSIAIGLPMPHVSRPGGCYEVQLTALADAAGAASLASRESARLGVPIRAVESAGLWKLRAGGCLDGDSAGALRDRARAEGYPGAFVVPAR